MWEVRWGGKLAESLERESVLQWAGPLEGKSAAVTVPQSWARATARRSAGPLGAASGAASAGMSESSWELPWAEESANALAEPREAPWVLALVDA